MPENPNKPGNWYDRKWNNKQARKHDKRRKERLADRDHARESRAPDASPEEAGGELLGVVAEPQKFFCMVMHEDGTIKCDTSGRCVQNDIPTLAVGDRVMFDEIEPGRGAVRRVLPRLSKLVRMRGDSTRSSEFGKDEHVLAANVDVAVIVASATAPPFHPRLIDRYLVMCQYGNVAPVICINKIDLVAEPPDLSVYRKMNIPVVYVSAATQQGLADIRSLLQGKVSVLTGHSGVGKSSIINRLLDRDVLAVGDVGRKRSRQGRHTTSVSTLNKLDDTSFLIDTPGIRSLELWDVDKATLRFYFPEFEGPSKFCKFSDCLHVIEPACAVKEAVENQEISRERYESYVRMMGD